MPACPSVWLRRAEALDRERFDEARRIASSIAKEAPSVSAVQEVLGLASYRLGRYKPAVAALQQAQELHENPALLPVIADCISRFTAMVGGGAGMGPDQGCLAVAGSNVGGAYRDGERAR